MSKISTDNPEWEVPPLVLQYADWASEGDKKHQFTYT